jgi:hypothetical protein
MGAAGTLAGALAGCAALSDGLDEEEPPGDDGPDEYRRLDTVGVHVAEGVDLSVPDEVETVSAPTDADVVVLPDETGVAADQAADWLADDRVLALLGADAEATWLGWARSDPFRDALDGGFADAEPDPQLLVGGAVGAHVRTYRHTWADGPDDDDVLEALDENLADLARRTPR